MRPQWPWSVYSQKHMSEMTTRSGAASLMVRIARGMMPLSLKFSLPCASLLSGMPNRITAGMRIAATSRTSSRSVSSDH